MREINNKKYFTLLILITVSTLMFSALGFYWNFRYYHDNALYTLTTPSLATAMRGIHDGLYVTDLSSFHSDYAVDNLSVIPISWESGQPADSSAQPPVTGILSELYAAESQPAVQEEPEVYDFTTATDDYFADACFIGDSRTVGISQYSGIENATFLCKTSL